MSTLYVMHFPATVCNYNDNSVHLSSVYRLPTTAFLVSILLKENHRIAGWLGTITVVDLTKKNGLLTSDSRDDFRGGALHCFCPRAPQTLVTPLIGCLRAPAPDPTHREFTWRHSSFKCRDAILNGRRQIVASTATFMDGGLFQSS